jgi:hypothetical protein
LKSLSVLDCVWLGDGDRYLSNKGVTSYFNGGALGTFAFVPAGGAYPALSLIIANSRSNNGVLSLAFGLSIKRHRFKACINLSFLGHADLSPRLA